MAAIAPPAAPMTLQQAPQQQQGDSSIQQALVAFATNGGGKHNISKSHIANIATLVSSSAASLAYFHYISSCPPPPTGDCFEYDAPCSGRISFEATGAVIDLEVSQFGKHINGQFMYAFVHGAEFLNGKVFYNHQDGSDFLSGPVNLTMQKNSENNHLIVTAKNQMQVIWRFETNTAVTSILPFEEIPSAQGTITVG